MPVLPLPVTMIETSFRAPLVAAVGLAPLLPPGSGTASEAAIALSAITAGAKEEHRAAFAVLANSLPENHFAMNRHAPPQAALDNGNGFVAI
jgi:hypothetical protein